MRKAKKILLKAFVAKTMLFIATVIALTSAIFGLLYLELYKGIPNMVLGELFVMVLLVDKLLTKRCWYSWAAYIILVSCNILNIVYLTTGIIDFEYAAIYPIITIPIALALAVIALFRKGNTPTGGSMGKDIEDTESSKATGIGGGVFIGDKPKQRTTDIGGGVFIGDKPKK